MTDPTVADGGEGHGTVSVHLPMTFRRRGGRKLVVIPGNKGPRPPPAMSRAVSPLVRAVVRAHRWAGLLERGEPGSIAELAAAERVDKSYLSKVLRLTLLAPEIVEAILNGTEPSGIRMDCLLQPFPNEWREQTNLFSARP